MLSDYDIPNYFSLQGMIMLGYPKSQDEDGYAKGEIMHGATVWQPTARRPLQYYLISKGRDLKSTVPMLTLFDKLKLSILSKSLKHLKKIFLVIDKTIHRIEFGKYLRDS
jgi:hypothetical protein